MVRSKSMQRQLINTCAGIMTDSYDTPYTDVEQLLDKAENSIFSIAENSVRGEDLVSVRDMLDSYFGHLEEISKLNDVVTGVTTGFPELDKRTAGLQPSDLIIVAARPSMGKTAFSLNLALNAAAAGKKVAFFSLEMSAEQLESRLISICSKVSLSKLRQPRYLSDDDWRSLYNAAQKLNCDLFIDDTPALRTLDLRAKARRMKSRVGLDLIVVDYLQLMRPSHPMASRELEISEISRTLKALAKELGPSGIRVNCVAPGVILTDMCAQVEPEILEEMAQDTPVGRNGTPADVAQAMAYLADAEFVTGNVLNVDGGYVI